MEIEKFCAVCGQSINIDLQYRQKINTICPSCESQTEWFFYKNGNYTQRIHVSEKGAEIQERMTENDAYEEA